MRRIGAFVDEPDLVRLGFERARPARTGRPAHRPSTLLKRHIYGDLNRIQSSRWPGREAQRTVELLWLIGRP